MADVFMTSEALEQFELLPKKIQGRVTEVRIRLESWPDVSGAKALSGELAGWYRIRTGDYRIRFHVKGAKIVIDKIGHRRDVYED